MTSLVTNSSAMNALSSLKSVNKGLETVQGRIATGLKVTSAKDNAAYYQISETMKGDSAAYSSINEGLTLTKNSIATARLGAETFQDLAGQFVERISFAQGAAGGLDEIEADLGEIIKQMETTISQSTFNGDDMVNADNLATVVTSAVSATGVVTENARTGADRTVVTGVTRSGGSFAATTTTIETQDLQAMLGDFKGMANGFATAGGAATTGQPYLQGLLVSAESVYSDATDAATSLGQSEETIEKQQSFLTKLVDNIDTGVGSMVDANMEEEAARLQAMQVQQQLATQALSIANSSPQNVLSLFR